MQFVSASHGARGCWSPACRGPERYPLPLHATHTVNTQSNQPGVRAYAVDAEFFYRQHQLSEAPRPLPPAAYAPSVDNSAWAAALLLAQHLDFGPAKQDLSSFFRGACVCEGAGDGRWVVWCMPSVPRGAP